MFINQREGKNGRVERTKHQEVKEIKTRGIGEEKREMTEWKRFKHGGKEVKEVKEKIQPESKKRQKRRLTVDTEVKGHRDERELAMRLTWLQRQHAVVLTQGSGGDKG